ncbi:GntR family transcriptional regulator [Streptomyces sp. S1]|uniref:GntR family transcriptional regulator n=1 Tax=Streptomyces sp. S1 TaxID=718288 RepID=UPI0013CE7119|nr:GntR family transcriptional regulator [Streptomyces sp. S1]
MSVQKWAGRLPAVKSKADLVYDSLRAAIASGELRPGERINMEELGRTFGVSKIPVREAVKRLESENLLTSRAHAGVTVAEVDHDEIRGVFLARQAIEGLVARLAAQEGDATLVDDLSLIQEAMHRALEENGAQTLSRLNTDFHRRIAAASGYRVLVDVTEQLLLTIQRYRLVIPRDDADWRSVLEEHEIVIDSLRTGGPDTVAAAARAHTVSQSRREADAIH